MIISTHGRRMRTAWIAGLLSFPVCALAIEFLPSKTSESPVRSTPLSNAVQQKTPQEIRHSIGPTDPIRKRIRTRRTTSTENSMPLPHWMPRKNRALRRRLPKRRDNIEADSTRKLPSVSSSTTGRPVGTKRLAARKRQPATSELYRFPSIDLAQARAEQPKSATDAEPIITRESLPPVDTLPLEPPNTDDEPPNTDDEQVQRELPTPAPRPEPKRSGKQRIFPEREAREINLAEAVRLALEFSPVIEILRSEVGIQEAEIIRQQANFDWNSFVESKWDDQSLPVGSDLTGAQNRFRDEQWTAQARLRRRNALGGNVQIGQELGHQDTNSLFFNPRNQGTSRVSLSYDQPLLQGAGRGVNLAIIDIAVSGRMASEGDFYTGLQDSILNVVRAYWTLALNRAQYRIAIDSAERADSIAHQISQRTKLDVSPVQRVRAEATVVSRQSDVIDARVAVLQAQEDLLQRIYGAQFPGFCDSELQPTDQIFCQGQTVELNQQVQIALSQRPEVVAALQRIRSASLEHRIAKNQLLPLLGMTLAVSNEGLRGNSDVHRAIRDQFRVGEPSYSVGFTFEQPLGNRAARANSRQAQLRVVQLQKEFEELVTQITRDARSNAHVVNAAKEKFEARKRSMALAQKELETIETRSKLLVEGDEVGRLYLDDILQTQERLAVAQVAHQEAQVNCILAHFELERATGQLINSQYAGPLDAGPLEGGLSPEESLLPYGSLSHREKRSISNANRTDRISTRPKEKFRFLQPGKMFATSAERK